MANLVSIGALSISAETIGQFQGIFENICGQERGKKKIDENVLLQFAHVQAIKDPRISGSVLRSGKIQAAQAYLDNRVNPSISSNPKQNFNLSKEQLNKEFSEWLTKNKHKDNICNSDNDPSGGAPVLVEKPRLEVASPDRNKNIIHSNAIQPEGVERIRTWCAESNARAWGCASFAAVVMVGGAILTGGAIGAVYLGLRTGVRPQLQYQPAILAGGSIPSNEI